MGRPVSIYHSHMSPKVLFSALLGFFEGYVGRLILEPEILISKIKENTGI